MDAEKQARVEKLLSDPKWQGRSTRQLAIRARVSQYLVRKLRQRSSRAGSSPALVEYTQGTGRRTTMDVGAIQPRRHKIDKPMDGIQEIAEECRRLIELGWRKTRAGEFKRALGRIYTASRLTSELIEAICG